jgi:hypothetical protein
MIRAAILAVAVLASCPAIAGTGRAERALSGPRPPAIDPGPRMAAPFDGAIIIRFADPSEVSRVCSRHGRVRALACTDMKSRIVTMPDEARSGLSTARWLALLRHEVLHAQGLDWHGPE